MAQTEISKAPGYRALLALVIILGVLIIAGVGGLIVGAVLRIQGPVNSVRPVALHIPAPGEHLDAIQTEGNRLLLHLSGPKGDEIVVLDQNFKILGRITIGP